MIIQRAKYDIAWRITVVISLLAVLDADGKTHGPHWLLPVLLGVAIAIAAYLSFFAVRDTEQSFAETQSDAIQEAAEPEAALKAIVVEDALERERTAAASLLWHQLANAHTNAMEHTTAQAQYYFLSTQMQEISRRKEQRELLTNMQQLLRKIAVDHLTRRNIAAEACSIARTLHGSGKEVVLYPDDSIGIRECAMSTKDTQLIPQMPGKAEFIN